MIAVLARPTRPRPILAALPDAALVPARPRYLSPIPDHIPTALRERLAWAAWRAVRRGGAGKWTKPPIDVRTGRYARVSDPATFAPFGETVSYYARRPDLDGIGCLLGGGIAGFDLDHCLDPATGAIAPWAVEIVALFDDAYLEVSPSGTGIRGFVAGALPGPGRKVGDIEVYDNARYLTVTGRPLPHGSVTIAPCQPALERLYASLADRSPTPVARTAEKSANADPAATAEPRRPARLAPVCLALATVDGAAAWASVAPRLTDRMRACAVGAAVARADGRPYSSGVDGGESNRDQALMTALLGAGLDNDRAAAAFAATPRGRALAARKADGSSPARLGRMVSRAREHLAAHPAVPGDGAAGAVAVAASLVARVAAQGGPDAVAVLVALVRHAPRMAPSQQRIAAMTGLSRHHVGDVVGGLEAAASPPVRIRRGLKQRNVYTLAAEPDGPAAILPFPVIDAIAASPPPQRAVALAAQAAVATLVALGASPTRQAIAACLGMRRDRVGGPLGMLSRAGHLSIATQAHGRHVYRPAVLDPDVRVVNTNQHGREGEREEGPAAVILLAPIVPPAPLGRLTDGTAAAGAARRRLHVDDLPWAVIEGRTLDAGTRWRLGSAAIDAARRRARPWERRG